MNDKELDELLNVWTVPPIPASLRRRVQAEFVARAAEKTRPNVPTRWKAAFSLGTRKSSIAAATIGILILLVMVTRAFSQMPGFVWPSLRILYTVDSEFIRYAADGSSSIDMYTTSFDHNGRELALSSSVPGHPVVTAIKQMLDVVGLVVFDLTRPFHAKAEQTARAFTLRHIQNGCLGGLVVGRETILGYPTVAIENRSREDKITTWMAPTLGCFALRITVEMRQPDGIYRLVSKKEALKVQWAR